MKSLEKIQMMIHHEVVKAITLENSRISPRGLVYDFHDAQGMPGLHMLGSAITNKFIEEYEEHQFDGDFAAVLEKYIIDKLEIS